MLDIIPHIQYLVSHKDCVVLPGWGAFISKRVNASVSDGIMYPQTRTTTFNQDITEDDGLIVESVVRKNGILYAVAKKDVATAVKWLKSLCDIAGFLNIPRVGTMRRDKNGNVIFTESEDSVLSYAYMSLPSIAVEDHKPETKAKPKAVQEGEKVVAKSNSGGSGVFGKVVATVAILIALGIALSSPVLVDRNKNQFASIPAPKITSAKTITIPTPAEPKMLYIPIPNPKTATEQAASFYVVVSSYTNNEQANRFIKEHPDEKLTVFESDDRFRVVAASANTFMEAQQIKHDTGLDSRFPDAWILKK